VVVPREFTAALLEAAAGRPRDPPVDVALVGDPVANANYVLAVGYLDGIVQQLAGAVTSRPQTADLRWEFLPGTGKLSDFDFGVPGLVVFGILFVVMTASTPLVREKVSGTLKRLRLSRARASDLLGGVTLSQLAVSVIQIPLVFGLAVAFGFHGAGSLPLAMGVGLLLTLTAVGLGCIVACLARNDGEAAAVSSAFLLPLALLSGGLFPMPDATVATIGGQAISLFDVLPTRHAAEALRRILVLGAGPGDVVYQVVMLAVLSVLTLLVGTALYRRLRLRAG
jgi:ABC-2 type transport system permease protein